MTGSGAREVRAARLVAHRSPLAVELVKLAPPGPDEVVVELEFAGINPVDRLIADGLVAPNGPLPRTIGLEGVGRVDGSLVVVHGGGLGTMRDGTFAQAVIAPRKALIEVPDGVPPAVAAAVAVAGGTAWDVVHEAAIGETDRVLVLGAGGGVGLSLVSLAHSIGAEVRGQIGSARKREAVLAAGADEVYDASHETLAAQLRGWQPTVVLDPLGAAFAAVAFDALSIGGRYVCFGSSAGAEATLNWEAMYRKSLRIVGYGGRNRSPEAGSAGVHGALTAVAEGRMRIPIERRYSLEAVNEALAHLAARAVTGKVVLDLTAR